MKKMFCTCYIKSLLFNLLHFPPDYIIIISYPSFLCILKLKYFQESTSETLSASAVIFHILWWDEQHQKYLKAVNDDDLTVFHLQPKQYQEINLQLNHF